MGPDLLGERRVPDFYMGTSCRTRVCSPTLSHTLRLESGISTSKARKGSIGWMLGGGRATYHDLLDASFLRESQFLASFLPMPKTCSHRGLLNPLRHQRRCRRRRRRRARIGFLSTVLDRFWKIDVSLSLSLSLSLSFSLTSLPRRREESRLKKFLICQKAYALLIGNVKLKQGFRESKT